MPETLTKLDN